MTKAKTTWRECQAYTLKERPEWQRSGRKSAILYSNKFTEFHMHDFNVYNITFRLILEDCNELKRLGKANGTLNRYVSAVSTVLHFAQRSSLISGDWTIPKFQRFPEAEGRNDRNAFTMDEVAKMIQFARTTLANDHLGDIILFATLTGMRQGEILKLTNDRIDLEQRSITIKSRKHKQGESGYVGIHNSLLPILTKRMANNKYGLTFGDDWLNADQMRERFHHCLRHIGKDVGIKTPWKFHGLRHTCGTLLIQSGLNIVEVATHMGHSSTRMTERYLHANDKDLAKRANSIDFAYV